jgi:NAD(P)-dependent dehydrogenase (short-subunit alcohol dehydrogenase family)
MSQKLKGKAAVVTGAGRGIGRAVAEALAEEGVSVVVNDPGVERTGVGGSTSIADEVVAEIRKKGHKAIASYDSVADFNASKNIIDSCVKEFGKIDILVSPAGVLRDRMLHNMSEEEWDVVVDVHLKGTFNCMRHASSYMREHRWGRIITFASQGWLGNVGQANYSAAKGGIVSLTRTAALELGKRGITVNAILPGARTRMTMDPTVVAGIKQKFEAGLMPKEHYEAFMGMPGPEYVAPVVLYLCTDEAANVNGKVISAHGGSISLFSEPQEIKSINKEGIWTLDELMEIMPREITKGLVNPSPPQEG